MSLEALMGAEAFQPLTEWAKREVAFLHRFEEGATSLLSDQPAERRLLARIDALARAAELCLVCGEALQAYHLLFRLCDRLREIQPALWPLAQSAVALGVTGRASITVGGSACRFQGADITAERNWQGSAHALQLCGDLLIGMALAAAGRPPTASVRDALPALFPSPPPPMSESVPRSLPPEVVRAILAHCDVAGALPLFGAIRDLSHPSQFVFRELPLLDTWERRDAQLTVAAMHQRYAARFVLMQGACGFQALSRAPLIEWALIGIHIALIWQPETVRRLVAEACGEAGPRVQASYAFYSGVAQTFIEPDRPNQIFR